MSLGTSLVRSQCIGLCRRVKHVCVCGLNYAFLGSDNDSSPVRNRVTVWTYAELLSIHYGAYFNGILIYSFLWESDFEIDVREISATLSRLQCAMTSIMYFWGQPSEWYLFGPCQITYKVMLNAMHCHHIVGLEISAKALMPLSQIPPECARSYCMPFHTSRSALSCNLWKQTNKQTYKWKGNRRLRTCQNLLI